MKLSIADKLALIYTSAGSLRKVAGITGLSHQQVSRILHKAAQGQSVEYYERQPEMSASIDVALDIHRDLARGVARRHKIPYNNALPIYAERLPLKHVGVYVDGELVQTGSLDWVKEYIADNDLHSQGRVQIKKLLGSRVGALHLHWITDRLRNAWIEANRKTGAYYAATVGSVVNLKIYNRQADKRAEERQKRGLSKRTESGLYGREALKLAQREGEQQKRVFTPLTPMDPKFPTGLVPQSIDQSLQTRHAPATGEPGTAFADQVILQLDTRETTHAAKQSARSSAKRSKAKTRK